MIVIDEQLLGRDIDRAISQWYRGKVWFVKKLRPETVIKDDNIPYLLHQQSQPTFVTINVSDFWLNMAGDARFCIICFALADSQARLLPSLLRRVLSHPNFRTKAQRMGHVLRVTQSTISFYSQSSPQIQTVVLPKSQIHVPGL